MDGKDRDARDAAGFGPYAREREQLVPMSSLGSWTVSDGEPDIRGWELRTVAGRQLGTVNDLLVDAKAGEVVLLDVDLPATDRHTFVPIRVVQIDRSRRVVLMDSADLPATDLALESRVRQSDRRDDPRPLQAEREIRVTRPRGADDAVVFDSAAGPASMSAESAKAERRRAERRIDRMNTEF